MAARPRYAASHSRKPSVGRGSDATLASSARAPSTSPARTRSVARCGGAPPDPSGRAAPSKQQSSSIPCCAICGAIIEDRRSLNELGVAASAQDRGSEVDLMKTPEPLAGLVKTWVW